MKTLTSYWLWLRSRSSLNPIWLYYLSLAGDATRYFDGTPYLPRTLCPWGPCWRGRRRHGACAERRHFRSPGHSWSSSPRAARPLGTTTSWSTPSIPGVMNNDVRITVGEYKRYALVTVYTSIPGKKSLMNLMNIWLFFAYHSLPTPTRLNFTHLVYLCGCVSMRKKYTRGRPKACVFVHVYACVSVRTRVVCVCDVPEADRRRRWRSRRTVDPSRSSSPILPSRYLQIHL